MMRIASIQVALPREHGQAGAAEAMRRPWTTAFFKEPVEGRVWLGLTNLDSDRQGDPEHHGGPDKAVMCYADAHYSLWRDELGRDFPHGGFGENWTVEGAENRRSASATCGRWARRACRCRSRASRAGRSRGAGG